MKQEQVLQAIEEQKKQVTEAYNAADKSTLKPSTVKQMDSMLTKGFDWCTKNWLYCADYVAANKTAQLQMIALNHAWPNDMVTELPAHVSAEYKAQKEAEAKQAIIDCDTAVAK